VLPAVHEKKSFVLQCFAKITEYSVICTVLFKLHREESQESWDVIMNIFK
jgi:hypothetical protein